MERRAFMGVLTGGLLAAPLAARAQQRVRAYRIGLLYNQVPATPSGQGPFYERMHELGWVYGKDYVVEQRGFLGQYERVPDLAAELVRSGVDIFVVQGGAEAVRMQTVTRTIPIVTTMAGDLVLSGVAVSLSRPGGNVTGVQTLQSQLVGKHLSLLKDLIPRLSRVGILLHVSDPSHIAPFDAATLREAEIAGRALGIGLETATVHDPNDIGQAFVTFQTERVQAVVILRDAFVGTYLKTFIDSARKYRLPTVCEIAHFAAEGGLISYGYNFADAERAAAGIVDKVLRGANISEIPIQQASTFRFTINLATAKALGVTVPPSLLASADQVIE